MSPTGQYGIDSLFLCDLGDEVDVGVVVEILSGKYLYEGIGETYVLCVGLEVLGCGNGDELDGFLVSEFHVGPLTHG